MPSQLNALTEKIQTGQHLDGAEVKIVATELLNDSETVAERARFLKSLAEKGETPDEIAGLVEGFLEHAIVPPLDLNSLEGPTIDVCGTGGDKLNLFNVSTTGMFILAAAGVNVVKHGNRGITSKSGGADVLEALGVKIDQSPEEFSACVRATRLGFLFAPHYHPAFKAVAPVRKQLAEEGTRTVFNILGPLLNPVRPLYQLIGVFSPELPEVFAQILAKLGRKRSWAVHGRTQDGAAMDELSTLGHNTVAETRDGQMSETMTLDPENFGFSASPISELAGGDSSKNASLLTGILDGSISGPKRDLVLFNAAAGLVIAGVAPNLEVGISIAEEQILNGRAIAKLHALRDFA